MPEGMAYSVGIELSAKVPDEPPVGTAVVTANGNVFQSQITMFGGKWVHGSCARDPKGDVFLMSWLELMATSGPVTIVYLPEGS
jgi:hypothetical protein